MKFENYEYKELYIEHICMTQNLLNLIFVIYRLFKLSLNEYHVSLQ